MRAKKLETGYQLTSYGTPGSLPTRCLAFLHVHDKDRELVIVDFLKRSSNELNAHWIEAIMPHLKDGMLIRSSLLGTFDSFVWFPSKIFYL